MLSENKEILFFFFDKYNLPSSLKGDTQTRSKKAWIRSMIESLLQCTSQRFQWRSFFTHHNKDGAGRLSSIEDCQVWLPKWWISSIVLVGGQNTIGNKRRFSCLQSNQKGVDMKIILHDVDTTARSTTFSWHWGFCLGSQKLFNVLQETPFVTGTGRNHREIILWPIFCTIGPEMAATLPALSGADNTGCFSGKEKSTC